MRNMLLVIRDDIALETLTWLVPSANDLSIEFPEACCAYFIDDRSEIGYVDILNLQGVYFEGVEEVYAGLSQMMECVTFGPLPEEEEEEEEED